MITRDFEINLRIPEQNHIPNLFQVIQNDKDVYNLVVHITDGISEIDYTHVSTATITFSKRDGTVVQGNMTVSADKLTYAMGTNEIAHPGPVLASIQLFGSGGERLTTARFQFDVIGDLITPAAVQSTSEFQILQQLKQDLEGIDVVDLTNQFNAHKADYTSKFPDNAGAHNSIFRGKNLGSTPDYANITNGSFKDMYIGDYWSINGVNWRIGAFNYYRNTGDILVPGNHVVIVPDTSLYSHVMNDTNTTDGGYTGSKMYLEGLEEAKTIINNAFPDHVVTIRKYLCNAVSDGQASAGAWFNSTVDLMNEVMVYGSIINGSSTYGLFNIGTEKSQLPLFALNPQSINTRYTYWLRDVASAAFFAYVDTGGYATRAYASSSYVVRPAFSIS